MHWYKRDPNAALVGMAELTLQECGAYNVILDLIYSREGILPNNDAMIARVMRVHGNEWNAVKAKLIAKGKIWVTPEGNLLAKRVEKTLKEAENFSETQRKRVGKRWEKHKNLSDNNDPSIPLPVIPIQPQPQPQQQRLRKKRPVVEPPEFVDFWNSVPKKEGKHSALKAYLNAVEEGANVFQINAAAKQWARREIDKKTEDKYIAMPATWLNQRRFEDYHQKEAIEKNTNLVYDEVHKRWRWKDGCGPENTRTD